MYLYFRFCPEYHSLISLLYTQKKQLNLPSTKSRSSLLPKHQAVSEAQFEILLSRRILYWLFTFCQTLVTEV